VIGFANLFFEYLVSLIAQKQQPQREFRKTGCGGDMAGYASCRLIV